MYFFLLHLDCLVPELKHGKVRKRLAARLVSSTAVSVLVSLQVRVANFAILTHFQRKNAIFMHHLFFFFNKRKNPETNSPSTYQNRQQVFGHNRASRASFLLFSAIARCQTHQTSPQVLKNKKGGTKKNTIKKKLTHRKQLGLDLLAPEVLENVPIHRLPIDP